MMGNLKDEDNEQLVWIVINCINHNEYGKFKLECNDCKRLIHYKCSELPVFQTLLDQNEEKTRQQV